MDNELLENILILSKQFADEYEALVDKELRPFIVELEAVGKAMELEQDIDKKLELIGVMTKIRLQLEDAHAELYQQDKIFKYVYGRVTGKI